MRFSSSATTFCEKVTSLERRLMDPHTHEELDRSSCVNRIESWPLTASIKPHTPPESREVAIGSTRPTGDNLPVPKRPFKVPLIAEPRGRWSQKKTLRASCGRLLFQVAVRLGLLRSARGSRRDLLPRTDVRPFQCQRRDTTSVRPRGTAVSWLFVALQVSVKAFVR